MITFRQLRDEIDKLTEEQKDCMVSVYLPWEDEYKEIEAELWFADVDNDVLDVDHPIIRIF